MSILFGHPTGNPNSHQAALAHFEAGRLAAFCVPWMPTVTTLHLLERVLPLRPMVQRLSRRYFEPLESAPKVQGKTAEFARLIQRALGRRDERLSYGANDWLMRTMTRECQYAPVTAIHAFEDCSLLQFEMAKRLGKACVYDMPIGYYPAWEQTQWELVRRYSDWLPSGGLPSARHVRPEQKRREMELADLVLVPGSFVEETIRAFYPYKKLARAAYGVNLDFWRPPSKYNQVKLRFLYVGQLSIRKGTPLLLDAWKAAALHDAELELVGSWQLSDSKRLELPRNVFWRPPCSQAALRERFWNAHVFVLPSFFEGFALALLEAMACGLPTIASEAAADPRMLTRERGRSIPTGNEEALVESLRWFSDHRGNLVEMGHAARKCAEDFTWRNYRQCVSEAVASFV